MKAPRPPTSQFGEFCIHAWGDAHHFTNVASWLGKPVPWGEGDRGAARRRGQNGGWAGLHPRAFLASWGTRECPAHIRAMKW